MLKIVSRVGVRIPASISRPLVNRCQSQSQSTSADTSTSTSTSTVNDYNFETLECQPHGHVMHVAINRPDKLNAMNRAFWRDIGDCFNKLSDDSSVRSIVLSGNGKLFSAGLDLTDLGDFTSLVQGEEDIARKAKRAYQIIRSYQDSFTSLEKCSKPVIAAIHGACVGGATNLVCAADIRYSTLDAWFQIKEVELGIAADVGALQRLPKIIGSESLVRELAFTARRLTVDEAIKIGFVTRTFSDKKSLLDASLTLAETIAKKSPVAVQLTKKQLNYARDHTTDEALEYHAVHNMAMLQSQDLLSAMMAQMTKQPAEFTDL